MKLLAVVIIALAMTACGGKKEKEEPRAGGPCSYKDEINPARILAVKKMEDGQYDIQVLLGDGHKAPSSRDTVWFSSLNHQYHITDSVIKAKNIKEGDSLQFVSSDIISGACTPHISQLKLEKYVKP